MRPDELHDNTKKYHCHLYLCSFPLLTLQNQGYTNKYNHLYTMSMYKGLIVAVVLLLIGGAGYYFKKAGVPDLVVQDINNDGRGSYGVSAIEVYSGEYECVENTGCKNKTRIVLGQDTTFDITAIVDGQEVSLGQGIWGVGTDGTLVVKIPSARPNSLIAKKISK